MITHDKLYIDGSWVPASSKGTLLVHNARDGSALGMVPAATAYDVDAAVRAASRALARWSVTEPAARADFLEAISQGIEARSDELARLIAQEVGMPIKLARRIQVGSPVGIFANYARIARTYPWEQKVDHSLVVRQAVGVVAAITPWNYPLHQAALKVAAALAAGCTVVLKPSEIAPLNAFVLASVIEEAGLPEGVFNLVSGSGSPVGEAMVAHEDVDMVTFTGSTRTGMHISEVAARTVKRVALELGGKSASVILDDADLASAGKSTVTTCYLNSGQTCTAWTRMLVPARRYEEAAKLAAEAARQLRPGDPLLETTRLGPLASAGQLERVRGYIRKGVAEGATLLSGGVETPENVPAGGYYVQPTVFGNVKREATIAQEEIFGPVLAIIPYANENDAVSIANDTVYGLAGGVWSGDEERARRVARRLRAGQVDINGAAFNPNAPFGGFKRSGIGREAGIYGLEEFLEYQSLQLPGR